MARKHKSQPGELVPGEDFDDHALDVQVGGDDDHGAEGPASGGEAQDSEAEDLAFMRRVRAVRRHR